MNPSVLIDLQQFLGNEKAGEMMKEMNYDPFENTKNQVKSLFSQLQDEDIVEILKKYNNSLEAAFDELEDRNSQIEENKKREKKMEEEKRRLENNNKYIETFVRNFQMFDKNDIELVFKNNDNDPQRTTNQLYLMMKERAQKNEEAKKLQREMEIQNMYVGFNENFPELSKEEIIEVIKKNELKVELIGFELGKMQKQKIFDELFIKYHDDFSSEEIKKILEESNWYKIKAIKRLTELQFEKEVGQHIKNEGQLHIPKLEFNQQQLENIKQESQSKMIDIQKIIKNEEVKNEEETKKKIENMIIENSNVEEVPIQDNNQPSQLECTITTTIEENKIVATVDFKSQSSYSWIGFYNKEDKDPNYKSYNYLYKLSENKFVVDKPLINGSYHFRVFANKYISVKVSEEIVLDKKDFVTLVRDEKNDKVINVSWQIGSVDPYALSAYVTVHKKEEERANYYRRWNWIKTFDGVHTFKTPIHTGEYEARVYFNGKLQFKSDILKIEGI
eukprot:TRINITY_DN1398_c0_g2_i1.p1 TRINITY_DN1398_c0_g2~~TRINITY_DN1398_c0_g2_i1.p1  ORF type:complete len:503 (-),score=203.91 TRINITY_DN1398_c0_g2_i1:54-1562(-)